MTERSYGEVLPGYELCEGHTCCYRGWCLGGCYKWDRKPMPDPTAGLTDEQIDAGEYNQPAYEEFIDGMGELDKVLRQAGVVASYSLVKACVEAGYDMEQDGYRVAYWLWDRMGKIVRSHEDGSVTL